MQSIGKIAVFATLLGLAFCLPFTPAGAKSTPVAPQGEFAKIDIDLAKTAMQILANGSPAEKQSIIANITAHPENYAPPVFYALSHVLFQDENKDEAAFWFYAGQLRARFDANRCADVSARQAVSVLNESYGLLINQYTFQNIPKLEALIPKVVEWDKRTPHNYDHRWINLHGMNAMMSGLGAKDAPLLSLPKDQWNSIAEKTRADYLSEFKKAMASLKNEQAD